MTHPGEPATTRAETRPRDEQRPVSALLGDLVRETRTLFRDEVQLAKAETRETLQVVMRNVATLGVGAALGIGAVLVLVLAASSGLTTLFALFMDLAIAVWLAPLVLALVLGLIAWALVKKGIDTIRRQSLVPGQTLETLEEDKEWIRRRMS